MSGVLNFLDDKQKVLALNDLKDFVKDSFLSKDKDSIGKRPLFDDLSLDSKRLYKYIIDPIYDLDGKLIESGYVLKNASSYNYSQKDFMFIADFINKIVILNDHLYLTTMYPYLELTQEERDLISSCIHTNSDNLSNDEFESFKKCKEYFIKKNIGSYKVLSATILKHEFNNNLYSFIEANLEDYAKKTDIENRYKEEIIMKSKDFFTGVSSFDRELSLGRGTPNYLKIINTCQDRLNDNVSYIYNYALDKSSILDKYKEFMGDIMLNDGDDGLKYSSVMEHGQ